MTLLKKTARGVIWITGTSIGSRIIGLFGTLILTRLITPKEYGDVSVASVMATTVAYLCGIGLLPYITAKPKAGRSAVFHITAIYLSLGFSGLLGFFFIREWVCLKLFHSTDMVRYIPGIILAAFMTYCSALPERILTRDLRFAIVGSVRAFAELIFALVTVGLAYFGKGAMAIVYGNLVRSSIFLLVFGFTANAKEWLTPGKLAWDTTRDIFSFSLPLAVSTWAHFASRNWDNLLIARFFGTRVVGMYNLAYNLADIPATQVGESIGDVLLPTFASMDHDDRKAALVRSTILLTLLIFPLAIGLGAVAETAIKAIFDARWYGMAPMLTLLSALSIFRPVSWTIMVYLQARHNTGWLMVLEIFKVLALMTLITVLSPIGVHWSCAGVGFAFGFDSLFALWVVRRKDNIPMRTFLWGMTPQSIACLPMGAAVLGIRWLLVRQGLSQNLIMLCIEIAVGAIVYFLSAMMIAPRASKDMLSVLKTAFNRKTGSEED